MRVSIHGVEVAVTGSLPATLLGELLGGFPPGDAARAADLVIGLEPAKRGPPEGLRPLFFYGDLQAWADGPEVLLSDGASTVRIAPEGRGLDVAVDARTDPHRLQHLIVFIALLWALRHWDLFHVHAAGLVTEDGRAVLVAGQAGSGKSTLALTLAATGLGYLGDDVVLLGKGVAGAGVLSFPRPFHVGEAAAGAFPALHPLLGPAAGNGKRTLDARCAFPGRERSAAARVAAVVLPSIEAGDQTTVEDVTASEALGALLEASAFLAVEEAETVRRRVERLRCLLGSARCVRARLGADLLAEPDAVARRILDRLTL